MCTESKFKHRETKIQNYTELKCTQQVAVHSIKMHSIKMCKNQNVRLDRPRTCFKIIPLPISTYGNSDWDSAIKSTSKIILPILETVPEIRSSIMTKDCKNAMHRCRGDAPQCPVLESSAQCDDDARPKIIPLPISTYGNSDWDSAIKSTSKIILPILETVPEIRSSIMTKDCKNAMHRCRGDAPQCPVLESSAQCDDDARPKATGGSQSLVNIKNAS